MLFGCRRGDCASGLKSGSAASQFLETGPCYFKLLLNWSPKSFRGLLHPRTRAMVRCRFFPFISCHVITFFFVFYSVSASKQAKTGRAFALAAAPYGFIWLSLLFHSHSYVQIVFLERYIIHSFDDSTAVR